MSDETIEDLTTLAAAELRPADVEIFRSLVTALHKVGREPPPNVGAPPGARCVTVADWQDEVARAMDAEPSVTMHRRVKMQVWRACERFWRLNLVGKDQGWVWRTWRLVHGVDPVPQDERPQNTTPPPPPPFFEPACDGASAEGQRFRELVAVLVNALGGDCSELDLYRVRVAAELAVISERVRQQVLRREDGVTLSDLAAIDTRAHSAWKVALGIR